MKTELTPNEKRRLINLGAKIDNSRAKGYKVNDDELIEFYTLINKSNGLNPHLSDK